MTQPSTGTHHVHGPQNQRWFDSSNVIVFGDPGAAKSSLINLIAGQTLAESSIHTYDSVFEASSHDVYLADDHHRRHRFRLFETAGLSGQLGVAQYLHALAKLHELICELYRTGGVRLLIFCICGGRVTAAMQQNYVLFRDAFCRRQVPVAFVVTGLENEVHMEKWMEVNGDDIKARGMYYDEHACITTSTNPAHARKYEISQQKVCDILSRFGTHQSWVLEPTRWLEATAEALLRWCETDGSRGRHVWPVRRTSQPKSIARTLQDVGFAPDSAGRLSHKLLRGLHLRERSFDGELPEVSPGDATLRGNTVRLPILGITDRIVEQPTSLITGPGDATFRRDTLLPVLDITDWIVEWPTSPTTGPGDATLRRNTLLPVPDITDWIVERPTLPTTGGGFSDIWKCGVKRGDKVENAAVKCLRSYSCTDGELIKRNKRLRRELKVWEKLDHENIMPLWGVASGFSPMLAMVCPWAENGTLTSYLERHQDLLLANRFSLLCNIAAGLQYLHACGVVHGDLTGTNILIKSDGKAWVADFGLSVILHEFSGTSYMTSTRCALRWADPELYHVPPSADTSSEISASLTDLPIAPPSAQSDIYSFGCIMLQVLSGDVPYHHLSRQEQVLWSLMNRDTPKRPRSPQLHIADEHWSFIQQCWMPHDALEIRRPTTDEVVDFVASEYSRLTRP
ncbi:kinase-like protein [Paxillus ammoniavirescens]|nr:kinase-like protein [Paxillus ammoniavirescens]